MNETADSLLDALDRVIQAHGPGGVTLRRVGTEAGLSHTAAAHYYQDKQGLFSAYLTRAWSQVADGAEAASANPSEREALLDTAQSYGAFALQNPAAFSVMSRMELANNDDQDLWAARERGFFALAATIQRAQENGWAVDRDPLDLIATTWSLVHGFVSLWVGGPLSAPYDGQDFGETLRRVVGDCLDALD